VIDINLLNIQFGVGEVPQPEGPPVRVLRFVDQQSGITVTIPLNPDAAQNMARQLVGGGLVVPAPPGGFAGNGGLS
jgi:hypothetical protein